MDEIVKEPENFSEEIPPDATALPEVQEPVDLPVTSPKNNLAISPEHLPSGVTIDVFDIDKLVALPQMVSMELFNMASRFMRYKDYNKSAQYFLHLIEKEPTWSESYINLGAILQEMNKPEEAVKFWKKAIEVNPRAYKAYVNIGKVHYANDRKEEAIAYWLMVATMQPDNYWNIFNLASAYQEKSDTFKYLFYLNKFIKICMQRGTAEFLQAKSALTKVEKICEKNYMIAQRCQKALHYQGALKAYKQIVNDNPWHFKAQLNLGALYYKNKKYEDALKHWLMAYIIDCEYLDNIANIAMTYEKMDKKTYAYAFYSRYNKMVGEDSFEVLKFKKRIEAIMVNKVALDPEIQIHLSKAEDFMKKQDFHHALIEYENYLELKPDREEETLIKIENAKKYINPEEALAEAYFEKAKELFYSRNYAAACELSTKSVMLYPEAPFRREVLSIYKSCSAVLKPNKK